MDNSFASSARVQLALHGYPQVLIDGRPAPLKLKRGLALLAYLSQRAQPVGRDALAALLWPDAPAGLGRGRLRRLVHELHDALGAGLVDGDPDTLRLAAGVGTDLQRTRKAIGAADVAALPVLGDARATGLLEGFTLDSEAFEDWLEAERRSLRAAMARALETAIDAALTANDTDAAERGGEALLRLEPLAEAGLIALLAARAARGDAAGVENAYCDGAQRWREEFGSRPSARVEAAYAAAVERLHGGAERPEIRFAPTAHGEVAYASWGGDGESEEAIVVMWGLMTNIEVGLDEPRVRALLGRLAQRHRIVMIDRRGMGLSERVGVAATAASANEDVCAVLDHLGLARAWLFGSSVGGTMAIDVALRRPDRVSGLLLYGTSASGRWSPETPWALHPRVLEAWLERLCDPAHYDEGLRRFAPSAADDPQVRAWYVRLLHNAASRLGVRELLRAFHALDLSPRLGAVRVPTLVMQREGDRVVPLAAGEHVARGIPGAELARLPGEDHFLWHGDSDAVARAVEGFVAQHAGVRWTQARAA
jgi:pimeloyl-ACP methyl ester carboxylesterase/DNA-binding SARP family transcriptional activator